MRRNRRACKVPTYFNYFSPENSINNEYNESLQSRNNVPTHDLLSYNRGPNCHQHKSSIIRAHPKRKYPWVYELKNMDTDIPFCSRSLIVISATSLKCLEDVYLKDFPHSSKCNVTNTDSSVSQVNKAKLKEVIIVGRGEKSQMYVMKGLHRLLHFTLGPKGVESIIDLVKHLSYEVTLTCVSHALPIGTENSYLLYLKTVTSKDRPSDFQIDYYNEMKKCALHIIPALFHPSVTSKYTFRSSNLINLGITNQKCDRYRHRTLGGMVDLDLIDVPQHISREGLRCIGELLLKVCSTYIPTSGYEEKFKSLSQYDLVWVRKFGEQLELTGEELDNFYIEGVSFLVNKNVNPHCDTMNPSDIEKDYTFSITINIPCKELPDSITSSISAIYKDTVPFCLVVYKRKALVSHSKAMERLDDYIKSEDSLSSDVKEEVIKILTSVNTDYDYIGYVYEKEHYKVHQKSFQSCKEIKTIETEEAVDKMGFWSSLLHVFHLFVCQHGYSFDDAIEFALFFTHQCNTTVVIVEVMLKILTEKRSIVTKKKRQDDFSLYIQLCNECGKKHNNKTIDVGCGKKNRFQPSNNTVYTKKQLKTLKCYLQLLFKDANKVMVQTQHSSYSLKTQIVSQLSFDIHNTCESGKKVFKGYGVLRIMHLIQLSSLLGILTLEFYVYTPLHNKGGVKKYLESRRTKQNKSVTSLLSWGDDEVRTLRECVGMNFTANMYENLCCIIGRTRRKLDVYYCLPRLSNTTYKMQICYRLKITQNYKITLYAFNGKDEYEVMCSRTESDDVIFEQNYDEHIMISLTVDIGKLRHLFA